MSTQDDRRDDTTDPQDDEPKPAKARVHWKGLWPADDARYDEHTIVLGGASPRPRPEASSAEAGFTPGGFLQRLQYLVQEGPCAPDPPDEDERDEEEELIEPEPEPEPEVSESQGSRNPYEVPEDELDDDDIIQMGMQEGALLAEYIRNLKAASKAKREARSKDGGEDPDEAPHGS